MILRYNCRLSVKVLLRNDEAINILPCADDVVLLAENEDDLQHMLNILSQWCNRNNMIVNCSKSNSVHFRPTAQRKTNFNFICCGENLQIADKYMYLGLLLHENLDFNITARTVAQSASRACINAGYREIHTQCRCLWRYGLATC